MLVRADFVCWWGRTWRRRWSRTVLFVVAALVVSLPVVVSARAASAGTTCAASAPDASSAASMARSCGERVEIMDGRDEVRQVFAEPSGLTTLEQALRPRFVHRDDGSWTTVDTTLRVNTDGSIGSVASTAPLALSSGGSNLLVTMTRAGHSLGLTWQGGALPVPALSGDTATYANVWPDIDLTVRALPDGFAEALVVKTAAAAANPALASVTFGVVAPGLTVRTDPDGTMSAVDAGGAQVFVSGAARMWDASSSSGTRVVDGGVADTGEPTHEVQMPVSVSAAGIVITPDQSLLSDPGARFPIVIDPSWTYTRTAGDSGSNWAQVYHAFPTTSYWRDTDAEGLRVGYEQDTGYINRSYYQFGIAALAKTHIFSATFSADERYAWTCTKLPVQAWRTDAITSSTTWNTKPTERVLQQSVNTGYGYNSSCPGPVTVSWDVTEAVTTSAAASSATVTIGLRTAETQTNPSDWHKYIANNANAKLVVSYNSYPTVSSVALGGGLPCLVGAGRPAINTTTPSVSAVVSDVDSGALTSAKFQWSTNGGSTWTTVGPDAGTPSGQVHQATLDVSASPASVYTWRAVPHDDFDDGTASQLCEFSVDTILPGVPTAASTSFALTTGTPVTVQGTVGVPGAVTLSPASGDTDVAGYQFAIGCTSPSQLTSWAPADANGSAAVAVTPTTSDPVDGNFLKVSAVDRAGNVSTPVTYQFLTGAGGAGVHECGYLGGDGRRDPIRVADDGHGNLRAWQWTAKTDNSAAMIGAPVSTWSGGASYPVNRTVALSGDFDGDGSTDVALFRDDDDVTRQVSVTVLGNDGNTLNKPSVPQWTATSWTWALTQLTVGDVTGDGKDDLVAVYHTGVGQWRVWVLASTSTGAGTFAFTATVWFQYTVGDVDTSTLKFVTGDFSGDGRADLGALQNMGSATTRLYVQTSTGSAFNSRTQWWASASGGWDWTLNTPYAGDVTGDGKADIVAKTANASYQMALQLFTSTGSAVSSPSSVFSSSTYEWDVSAVGVVVGDLTSDGKADVSLWYACCGTGQTRLYTATSTGSTLTALTQRWAGATGDEWVAPVLPVAGTRYTLVAVHSNRCLDVPGASTANGTQLVQHCESPSALNDTFTFSPVGGAFYQLVPSHTTGKCVGVSAGNPADTTPVVQWTCGAADQVHQLYYVAGYGANTVVTVRPVFSGKCLDVVGASTADNALIQQYTCGAIAPNQPNQLFYLRPV